MRDTELEICVKRAELSRRESVAHTRRSALSIRLALSVHLLFVTWLSMCAGRAVGRHSGSLAAAAGLTLIW